MLDVWVGGLTSDQAKVIDMVEWHSLITPNWMTKNNAIFYCKGIEASEYAERQLKKGVANFFESAGNQMFKKNDRGQYAHRDKRSRELRDAIMSVAATIYWNSLDQKSRSLISLAETFETEGMNEWLNTIRFSMHTAYSQTCPHETPRQIEAYAQGWQILKAWKDKKEQD